MEKKEKLGQEPAFPLPFETHKQIAEGYGMNEFGLGMNKRFYTACAAMKTVKPPDMFVGDEETIRSFHRWAILCYRMADALLEQENK